MASDMKIMEGEDGTFSRRADPEFPAFYVTGTRGSFPGVKRPGREADHSPPSSAEVKEWVELYLHFPNTP
jgi:hypothetical protein